MSQLSDNTTKLNSILNAVNALPDAGSTDLPELSNPAISSDILSGKDAINQSGQRVVGTLVQLNTSDATAIASDIKSGKTAYAQGIKVTGTMGAFSDLEGNDGSVALKAGVYQGSNTTPPEYMRGIYVNIGSQPKYTPTGSEVYLGHISLGGALIPENIKSGITILGVTGTYSAGSETEVYQRGYVDGLNFGFADYVDWEMVSNKTGFDITFTNSHPSYSVYISFTVSDGGSSHTFTKTLLYNSSCSWDEGDLSTSSYQDETWTVTINEMRWNV